MSQSARPLRITIVSPDTGVLHDLCWMLTAVGYEVVTSKDTGERAAWRQFSETDFLLFDGRLVPDPTPATLAYHSDNPIYRIFLYDPTASVDLRAWFVAGANDGLRVPISRGELLVRTRVGARVLEFENRMRSQSSRSRLPEIYSMRGFLRKLNKITTEAGLPSPEHTLLTTTIDFFSGFCRAEGESAAQDMLTILATAIRESVDDNAIAAHVGDGIFHVLLPDRAVDAARIVAEQIAQTFRATQVESEHRPRLSLTTAIVPWQIGVNPEQLLDQGRETLAIAKQSGDDCAIEQNVFAQELSNWQNELIAGSPFSNVVAQDLMEPFPSVLTRESVDEAILTALSRSGAPVWPFVDHEGRLVGVALSPVDTDANVEWGPNSNGSQLVTNPTTIAYNAAFPEIYEAFSTQGCPEIVVVADQRPIGYITFRGFTSLVERVNSATFSCDQPTIDDSRSLLVGSLVNESEVALDSDQ
jgi:GGDEF domain-containing protein